MTAIVCLGSRTTLQFATAVVWIGTCTLQFRWPGDLDCWSFNVASLLTDREIHLATETEQDQIRLSLLQYGFKEKN